MSRLNSREVVSSLVTFVPINYLCSIPEKVRKRMGTEERNLPVFGAGNGFLFFKDGKGEINFISVFDCEGASLRWSM